MRWSLLVVLFFATLGLDCLRPTGVRRVARGCVTCMVDHHRNRREEDQLFASVAWGSPLEGHRTNIVCPMQDDYMETRDLSYILFPEWLRTHKDPVGRCPVIYRQVVDPKRLWPPILLAVQCACERSRCTHRGAHYCMTVYVARTVHKIEEGRKRELVSVDCVCAVQRATIIRMVFPALVSR